MAINNLRKVSEQVELRHPNHSAVVDANGITFLPKSGAQAWKWELTAIRLNGKQLIGSQGSTTEIKNSKIEINRGQIIEQYVPKVDSIEQNYIVPQPLGEGDLLIAGTVSADGAFEKSARGSIWRTGNGVVSLGNVYVYYAEGKSIPAEFTFTGSSTKMLVKGKDLEP